MVYLLYRLIGSEKDLLGVFGTAKAAHESRLADECGKYYIEEWFITE